jgi:hypothetical protein
MRKLMLMAACVVLAACGGRSSGPKTPMTEAQFDELQVNCNVPDATFGPSNYTETTEENGVTSTTTYEAEPGEMSIFLPESQVASHMHCISEEFERMGAEAKLVIRGLGGDISFD